MQVFHHHLHDQYQEQKASQVLQDLLDSLVNQDWLDCQVSMDLQVHEVTKVVRDRQAQQVSKVLQDHSDLLVYQVPQACQGDLVHLETEV